MKRSEVVGILILVVMVLAITAATMLGNRKEYSAIESQTAVEPKTTNTLFTFDPNTVTYDELLALGFEKQTAVSLLKYRSRGKVFEIAEELALCYGVTDSIFKALRPYITIGEEFKPKPIVYHSKTTAKSDSLRTVRQQQWEAKISKRTPHPKERFRIDTVGIAYLQSIGFTYRQAEGLIEYRDSGAEGIRNMAELSDCWAVSVEMADSLARYIIFPEPKPHNCKIEINSADSATLRKVRGIGAKTVVAVMQYRKLLGGFVRKEQIAELKCVTKENFDKISTQIYCDSCKISKIDINFASPKELERHPYVSAQALRRIIKHRKLKGGWSTIEEMIEDNIFSQEEAARIAPYLDFGTRSE